MVWEATGDGSSFCPLLPRETQVEVGLFRGAWWIEAVCSCHSDFQRISKLYPKVFLRDFHFMHFLAFKNASLEAMDELGTGFLSVTKFR